MVISPLSSFPEMTAEMSQAIDREEKILVAAKGPESTALDMVTNGRVMFLNRNANYSGVLEEQKRRLARTENATGSKSSASLQALRDVAEAYYLLRNWPEEERIWLALVDRTAALDGKISSNYASLLQTVSRRYGENQRYDEAVSWIDRAIEVMRQLPDAEPLLQFAMPQRASILQMKNTSLTPSGSANPFYQPRPNARWFNTPGFTGIAVGK